MRRPDVGPLSIVHLTTFLQGGAGRAVVDLACAQHAQGHDVLVATSATGEPGYESYPHYLDRLAEAGVSTLVVDSFFKRDATLNHRALTAVTAKRRPEDVDIVHAHAATPARIGLRYAGTRAQAVVVQTQHGWGINKTAAQAQEDLAVLREVETVIVTSRASATWLAANGVERSKMIVIPCGLPSVSPEIASEAVLLVEDLRRTTACVVGCVGSVTVNKNQRALVRALGTPTMRDVSAVFVGEGGEAVEQWARAAGVADRVRCTGYRADAAAWMPAFDLLVAPSLSEGQGLVAIEAFRAGTPLVAADIPPFREVVDEGGTGWLFDPLQSDALAAAVNRVRRAPTVARAGVIASARRRFEERFTFEQMSAAHDAVYRTALAGRRTSSESAAA